jgi:2,3-bisphosphoglycerate-dependent phosphoglycerate mutase
MAKLVLVRHGKSEWNKTGQWTGWTDVGLVEEGLEEARRAGESIKNIHIDAVHVSNLRRTHETWKEIQDVIGRQDLTAVVGEPLKERSYGIHTGKNKWEVKEQIGDEEFHKIRRSWNFPIPGGETMKDVHDRAVPYYETHILPELKAGKNVLIVGHGNTLRALVKYLEKMDEGGVSDLEFGTGEAWIYNVDADGALEGKEVRATNENRGKV